LDILLASIALLALSPLLLLIALLIMIESRGPVIYRSQRVGTGYRVFDFLKFRSMYKDADKRLNDLKHLNQYVSGDNRGGLFLKFNNDPRVTFIGRLIRKTSLDELPQLFNVLMGDMSIVGNRPLPLYEAELLTKDAWAQRFLAPAGLTGLWQVTKRGKKNMSSEERIGLDVSYAHSHSFWNDLKIILRTFPAMIQSENV
ncbi:MAG: sugar transferase, partial [Saprospiraceae bacterium]